MRDGPVLVRLLFCLAVALTAAALADPLVEAASNAGLFGSGSAALTDHSTADVLPALCVGAVLAALFVVGTVYRALSQSRFAPGWLRLSVAALPVSVVARLFPTVFVLQIGALYGMETLEQATILGKTLGGTVWLGGPIAFSLTVHGVACALVIAVFSQLLQWLAQTLLDAVRFVRLLVLAWPGISGPRLARAAPRPFLRSDDPTIARPKGRAPPRPTA